MKPNKTDFGYQEVDWSEKQSKVNQVFESVAPRYDVMNDLMSLGIHRLWKRSAIQHSGLRPGMQVLDLAGGTGDLSALMAPIVGSRGHITLCDINPAMLKVGRSRLENEGNFQNITYALGNAEALPFADQQFDLITIAFGLRNVRDKQTALQSMQRCLKPGGKLLVLEFSEPKSWMRPAYDLYSFQLLPRLGQWIAKDAASYRYLAESIRQHPNQENLKSMILKAGFMTCQYENFSGGIVALHTGVK